MTFNKHFVIIQLIGILRLKSDKVSDRLRIILRLRPH